MLNKINHITPDLLLKPNHRFLRHALLQLAILLVTINILWDEPTHILPDRLWAWGVYLLMFNLTIYTNMYGLVPLFLLKGRTRLYLILIGLLIFSFVFSLGMLQVIAEGEGNDVPTKAPVWIGLISGIGSFALFMGGLTSLQLFKYRVENQRRIYQLEGATMAVELANLQNQINPHFLFNMLNNANIMAGEDARKSSYMLTKLNDLLRYQVDKGSVELVPLKEDIGMLRDYLELEKVRRDRFSYTIFVEGNTALELPPLLFIPFVENAVKHNPENDSFVEITFRITAAKLYFECKNPKAGSSPPQKEGGIGLGNIRRRLDLLYGGNHRLMLRDENNTYTAILELGYR